MSELLDYLTKNEESFRKARIPALYSDFSSQRSANPDGYAANASAWRRALPRITRTNLNPTGTRDRLLLAADETLLRALESRQYGRPLALGAVIADAIADGEIVPLAAFHAAKGSILRGRGGKSGSGITLAGLPWAVLGWGLRQIGIAGASAGEKLPGGQFVVIANAEAATSTFSSQMSTAETRAEQVWSKAHFKKVFADTLLGEDAPLSDTDVDILLTFMARDKGVVAFDGDTVKYISSNTQDKSKSPPTITAEDTALAQLTELIIYLTHQTNLLTTRITELNEAARTHTLAKNRIAALAALRSRKRAEASLSTRYAALAQAEDTMSKLEQAADNVALVGALANASDALAGLNAKVGGAEGVDDVMEKLRDQMGTADEIGTILSEEGKAVIIDEGEVDDELEQMMKEEEDKKREKEAQEAREKREKEAQETREKLEALDKVKPLPEKEKEKGVEVLAGETAEGIKKLTIDDEQDGVKESERVMELAS